MTRDDETTLVTLVLEVQLRVPRGTTDDAAFKLAGERVRREPWGARSNVEGIALVRCSAWRPASRDESCT